MHRATMVSIARFWSTLYRPDFDYVDRLLLERKLGEWARLLLLCGLPLILHAQAELFIHNYHQVDSHVLRGAEPGSNGIHALAANGVKTILDLRPANEREGKEKQQAESLKLNYVNIPMNGYRAPTDAEVEKALGVLNDSSAWPVFVHCKYGEDRTGTVIACYRVKHDGWSNEKALAEAKKNGMHPWERGMKKYILAFAGS